MFAIRMILRWLTIYTESKYLCTRMEYMIIEIVTITAF